jgi:hypothetical protein
MRVASIARNAVAKAAKAAMNAIAWSAIIVSVVRPIGGSGGHRSHQKNASRTEATAANSTGPARPDSSLSVFRAGVGLDCVGPDLLTAFVGLPIVRFMKPLRINIFDSVIFIGLAFNAAAIALIVYFLYF